VGKYYSTEGWARIVEQSTNPVKYPDPKRCPTCGWAIKSHTSRELRTCRKEATA
jgi:hypothetical protein